MSTYRKWFQTGLCAAALVCATLSAHATPVVFNFDADPVGTYNSVDVVNGLGLGYYGAATVCDTTGLGFAKLSGNALATGACDYQTGGTILAFSSPVYGLTFDYAVDDTDPLVALFLLDAVPVGMVVLDDNMGTFEGSRAFADKFDGIIFGINNIYTNYAIDNISVTPVPEPSSLLLLGTGAIGMVGAVRRRLSV